ncbi:hypothetical protein C8A05DRAFT_33222 [Staphylotrichum tortipilum]|uniref:NADAR domain-containing protein n=1 Tax=Staphylotrichum tortipilum TaxID=2831512 RepID=A0AAN6MLC6_9PEZI|nr:hypothetical protein C8A05DRAFT_33222 [Staphylotrichum longicolle]
MPPKRSKPQHRVTKSARAGGRRKATTVTPTPNRADANSSSSSSSPVYFWRDSDPLTGYLSQWYPCAFSDDADPSIIYPTAEHYMMYQKALLFSDAAVAAEVLAAAHPRQVKALGRKVSGFSDEVWNAHREAIVRRGNVLKFTRPVEPLAEGSGWIVTVPGGEEGGEKGVSIKEMLLGTGEREIVEASPMDRIWGIGFGAAKAGSVRERWGLNLLGKALMVVRGELRAAATAAAQGDAVAATGSGEAREGKEEEKRD